MPKKIFFTCSVLLINVLLTSTIEIYAASSDEQQLTARQRAEQYRKRKPKIAEKAGISASLNALRKNGVLSRVSRRRASNRVAIRQNTNVSIRAAQATTVDTSETETVIAIKHVLTCDTQANCQTAVNWGISNNFNTTEVLTSKGHGGEILYHLLLRQEVTPDADAIANESNRVDEGVQTLEGIRYATWMVDLNPDETQDDGGN